MKTRLPERYLRWPGALTDARRAVSVAWRRAREPALRGAPPASSRTAWAFVTWIAIVGVAYALIRGAG